MSSRNNSRGVSLCNVALAALSISLGASAPAWAQATATTPNSSEATAAEANEESTGLSEIVVTAQKRETNLQRTPIAISVATAEDLDNRRIKSLADLADGSIPSLRIAPFFSRNSAFNIGIRGIFPSSDANQPARDTATGVYIDGVYLGRPQGLGAALYDIERIEVLKGPQGTLFGRNSTGGAVSIVTRKPTGEFNFRQTVGVRNLNGYSTETHVDLPTFADVSLKFDGLITKRDGTVDNPAPGQNDFNSYDRRGFHARALWEPTDTFSVDYNYDISYDATTPNYVQLESVGVGGGRLAPLMQVQSSRAEIADIGVPERLSVGNIDGHSLTMTWELSENLEVRSITSYRTLKQTQWDNGGARTAFVPNAQFARYSIAGMNQSQVSQEFQLVGTLPHLNYVAGLYYFRETGGDYAWAPNTLQWNATGTAFTPLATLEAGAQSPFADRESTARAKSLAAFAQATWSPEFLDERAHFTAGARYTQDDKSGSLLQVNGLPDTSKFSFSDERVDPAVSVAFDVTNDIHVYAKWGTAYRAGGANSRSLTYRPFGPEVVTSREIGVKSEFWDNRARLNLAAFTTDYEDIQVDFNRNVLTPGVNRTTNETVNVPGAAKIEGYEAELTVMPIEGLTLNASYAYTTAEIPSAINPFNNVLSPLNIVYTPENSYSIGADYVRPMNGFTVRAHIDANAADGYRSGNSIASAPLTDSSFIVNGRLAVTDIGLKSGHNLELSLWSRNLLDEDHAFFRSFNSSTRFTTAMFNEPRSFGIDATIRY